MRSCEKVKKCAIRAKTLKSENRKVNELEPEGRRGCLNRVSHSISFVRVSFLGEVSYDMFDSMLQTFSADDIQISSSDEAICDLLRKIQSCRLKELQYLIW